MTGTLLERARQTIAAQLTSAPVTKKRVSFSEYLPLTMPANWNSEAKHIRLIAQNLDRVFTGEIDRLAILMPPRHGKTETATIRGSLYAIDQLAARTLITGYNERYARRLSRKVRNLATARVRIASDKSATDEWETSAGGVMQARGVGNPPTGDGFNFIFIDDPIRSRADAESEVYRENLWDWYSDGVYTRLEPGGAIVLTITHWHHDDLAARAIASEPDRWTVLKLPAIAEAGDPLGRKPGEALWPERYDEEALGRIRSVMLKEEGEYSWESLFQQNPQPREGALFKVSQLTIVDAIPADTKRAVIAFDLAASAGRGDYTVGVDMAGPTPEGYYIVRRVFRGQWDAGERDKRMLQFAQTADGHVTVRLPQDPGQAGKQQAAYLTRLFAGFDIVARPVSGDKEVRASPVAAQVNAGNVLLARGEWNAQLIEELRQFPNGKHDDQVDALADAFAQLTTKREITIV